MRKVTKTQGQHNRLSLLESCFWALVLCLIALLPFIGEDINAGDGYFLEASVTADHDGVFQVFYDIGNGIREKDSSYQVFAKEKPGQLRLKLPIGSIRRLRIDPSNHSGLLLLAKPRIADSQGETVFELHANDLRIGNQINSLTESADGTIEFRFPENANDPLCDLVLGSPLILSKPTHWRFREQIPFFTGIFLTSLFLVVVGRSHKANQQLFGLWHLATKHPLRALVASSVFTVMIQCHPMIFQGRSLALPPSLYDNNPSLPGYTDTSTDDTRMSDVAALVDQHMNYPVVQRQALKEKSLPLWNRYSMCGTPLLGQGQSMFGDPLEFLTIAANSAAWAWDLRFLLARFILCLGVGLNVWLLTRSITSSILSSTASCLVGFFLFRLIHPANFSYCYAPWVLAPWLLLSQANTRAKLCGAGLLAVLSHVMLFTSGTMKESTMSMLCLDLAGLACLAATQGQRISTFLIRVVVMTLALASFILITAPVWNTFLHSLARSFTGYDTPACIQLPLWQLLGFFDELVLAQLNPEEMIGYPGANFLILGGILWLCAAGFSTWNRRQHIALCMATLFPLAMVFGGIPQSFIKTLPFFANIHTVHWSFGCPLLILAALVAGIGFSRFEHMNSSQRRSSYLGFLILLACVLALFFTSPDVPPSSLFFRLYLGTMVATLVLVPYLFLRLQPQKNAILTATLLCALVSLLCWRFVQYKASSVDFYVANPQQRADLHAKSPAIEEIRSRMSEPSRINGLGNTLFLNYANMLGFESINGVDAVRNKRFHEMASAFGLQRVVNWSGDYPVDEASFRSLQPAYNLLNVRYFLGEKDIQVGTYPELTLLRRADLNVYENPQAWPRAFFCDSPVTYKSLQDFVALINHGDRIPVAAISLVEPPRQFKVNLADFTAPPKPNRIIVPATDYRLTANKTTFTIRATSPGVVVLSETYYSDDFTVTLNGQRVDYFPVNYCFKGISIPTAGTYQVSFEYSPSNLGTSLLLFWLGLGLLIPLILGTCHPFLRPKNKRNARMAEIHAP